MAAFPDVYDGLVGCHVAGGHEEHRDGCCGSLHACCAMDKHWLACLIFPGHLQDDFKGPEFHIADLFGLQIIVNGHSILSLYAWHKGNVFRAVENALDAVLAEPIGI